MEFDDKAESNGNMDVDEAIPTDSNVHSITHQDMETESHDDDKTTDEQCSSELNKTDLESTKSVSEEQESGEQKDEEDTVITLNEELAVCGAVEDSGEMTQDAVASSIDQVPVQEEKFEQTSVSTTLAAPVKEQVESDNEVEVVNVAEDKYGNLKIIGKRPERTSIDASPPDAGANLDPEDPEFSLRSKKSRKMLKKTVPVPQPKKRSSTGGTPRGEMDSEKVAVPFEQGWAREIVIRNSALEDTPANKFRHMDVYYFSPEGVKLRSMPMISDHLKKMKSSLTLENFTFLKRTIFREPFEIIREAGTGKRPMNKAGKKRFSLSPKRKFKKVGKARRSFDSLSTSPGSKSPVSPKGSLFNSLGLGPVSAAKKLMLSPSKSPKKMAAPDTKAVNGSTTVATSEKFSSAPGNTPVVKKNVAKKKKVPTATLR